MKFILSVFFLIGVLVARAQESRKGQFQLGCSVGTKTFSIGFHSKSGDFAEDDMEAILKVDGRAQNLGIQPSWFLYTDHIAKNLQSVCKDPTQANPFAAYQVGKDQVLFFIKTSGRPGYDQV